jgi:HEAT repeat protein
MKVLRPLAVLLNDQVPAFGGTLDHSDLGARLSAYQALEAMAEAREKWLELAARLEAMPEVRGRWQERAPWERKPVKKVRPGKPGADPFAALALPAAVRLLAKGLDDKEIQVKLAALYVLETLNADAAPAAERAAKLLLLRDDNLFVRWGAVRMLGRMAPLEADKAVPALASVVNDPNGDVRVTALAALERFGPAAKAAVPDLCKALSREKVPSHRVWVIKALEAIGKEAHEAVPELITAMAARQLHRRSASLVPMLTRPKRH